MTGTMLKLRPSYIHVIIPCALISRASRHPMSYVGDPRLAAQLAPETADAADQYFAEFRRAGFRVGICIRPD